ncbi:hypothetical protein L2E82_09090 [Cichorium intybus]|uniref:Uncharacterized protein n=1 Tax=Cichorium intybus TaxID=13427 RepID=A0ACB9G7H5_CICIN|nr:hypothetical protein L2E82_09090 [Cichorium intybus]
MHLDLFSSTVTLKSSTFWWLRCIQSLKVKHLRRLNFILLLRLAAVERSFLSQCKRSFEPLCFAFLLMGFVTYTQFHIDNVLPRMKEKKIMALKPFVDRLGYHNVPQETNKLRMLDILFILQVEHKMNCSTAAARHLTSSGVYVYTALAGTVGALYGPLYGGANEVC